jgi:hypothetical protein
VEFGHTIHVVNTFRVSSFFPYDFTLLGLLINKTNFAVPVPFDPVMDTF